jgi:hypothetical protein
VKRRKEKREEKRREEKRYIGEVVISLNAEGGGR